MTLRERLVMQNGSDLNKKPSFLNQTTNKATNGQAENSQFLKEVADFVSKVVSPAHGLDESKK